MNTPLRTQTVEFWEEFDLFVAEFRNESDRAAVILGAAKLDSVLYQLLASVLAPSTSSTDELLDSDGPLSSFSARINMAYRLNLIDRDLTKALHLIRKLRNSFAHEVSGCNLNAGPHRDRVRELARPLERNGLLKYLREEMVGDSQSPVADFRAVLALAIVRLEVAAALAEPLGGPPTRLIPGEWQPPDAAREQLELPKPDPADTVEQ